MSIVPAPAGARPVRARAAPGGISPGRSLTSGAAIREIRALVPDPDGPLFVRHPVGSERWSPDGFTRMVTSRAPRT